MTPSWLFKCSLWCALPVSLYTPFWLDTLPSSAPCCVWMLRGSNPLPSAPLLWPQLHSSHAPLTRSLSLPLSMHESLSFFLLTTVRASQKCLHLLSSIMHSIFSTNQQCLPALGHNSLAGGGWFPPHSTPSPCPTTFILCPTGTHLNRANECYTLPTAGSSLLPPLLLSQHCSSSGSAWLCQGKAAGVPRMPLMEAAH